ncbi:hypothetical protein [Piscirickettsia litoralis]|uniref:DUF2345 domain-containing protein n=1 Tax=Piscirickettsia litoralis TaxID=1891921 RepID=A0ABX3A055_9GAMM|nr:hypothetical protein [Piscirickettsia litoralis]ODN41647.1 hypothetical protein BGC07_16265 [Piscirickettsia litoralis]
MASNIISSVISDKEGIELNALKDDKTTTLSLQSEQSLLTAAADTILVKSQKNGVFSVEESKISIDEKSIQISVGDDSYIRIEDGKIELSCSGNIIELGSTIKINGADIKVSSQKNVNISATQEVALKAITVSAS